MIATEAYPDAAGGLPPDLQEMATDDPWPQYRTNVQYSNASSLNTLQICFPRPTTTSHKQIWVIFVHGGAWLDPEIDASSFDKTQELLLQMPEVERIAAFASINYRLSPDPTRATNPSLPEDHARNAKHPDHINDLLAALLHLQETYAFDDRYLLVGHSCGATMALQVAMSRKWTSNDASTTTKTFKLIPPMAILGVEGLYDLPALVDYHKDTPEYLSFVTNAFGSDRAIWAGASPVNAHYETSWPDGRLVVLAHSREDELVEWEQVELQQKALQAQGWESGKGVRRVELIELRGKHDEVWEDGKELARAIQLAVQEMKAFL